MAMKGYSVLPQRSCITEASTSDCLVSYPEHLLEESYPSADMQSVNSAAPANWAKNYAWLSIISIMFLRDPLFV